MKPEQKYATRMFWSLKSAESFKKKVGSNFNIKELKPETPYDLKIRYAVRFKIDKTRNNFKALVEIPGKNQFFPSYPNVKEYRDVRKANKKELFTHLKSVGIYLSDKKYGECVETVAKKFYKELAQNTPLIYDEVENNGFYLQETIKIN